MSVCVVSFSSRKNGNCAKISDLVCTQFRNVSRFDFSDFEIHPCGSCEYECFTDASRCPWIHDREYELLDAITRSEQTYFILPNYCGYPCANFFIFNERSLCYFQNNAELLDAYERVPKKAIVVSNTDGENISAALAYHGLEVPQILFLSAKRFGKSSIGGDLLTSVQARADLKQFIMAT